MTHETHSDLTRNVEAAHSWLDEILGVDDDRTAENLRLRCERVAKRHLVIPRGLGDVRVSIKGIPVDATPAVM